MGTAPDWKFHLLQYVKAGVGANVGELIGQGVGAGVGFFLGGPIGAFAVGALGRGLGAAGTLAAEAVFTQRVRRIGEARPGEHHRTPYLDLATSHVESSYGENGRASGWVETVGGADRTPYFMTVDFRARPDDTTWGTYAIGGDYAFPGALRAHRDAMVAAFEAEGKLRRDDVLPRLCSLRVVGEELHYDLERAHYHDQIGTNLSLDYRLAAAIEGHACVRDWDQAQAGIDRRAAKLPTFDASRLANTIGVAVAVTVRDGNQKKMIVRKRTKNVAVYGDMIHPALTFALELEQGIAPQGPMKKMIEDDLKVESLEELYLDSLDQFYPLRPLALCRDLVRGGKPQFFLELEIREGAWDKIEAQIGAWDHLAQGDANREYTDPGVPAADARKDAVSSPETEALLVLLNLRR